MKKIAVDHLPLCDNPLLSNDYISSIIYTAIMDPLYINGNKNSCINMEIIDYRKYYIEVRNDLKFDNGEKVSIDDYYDSLKRILNSSSFSKHVFENVNKYYIENHKLVIELFHKDRLFIDKLSLFSFAPYKNGLTSGPYYISKSNKKKIVLSRNKYYRNNINNSKLSKLEFFTCDNDIDEFLRKSINMTNDTTFPVKLIKKIKPNIGLSNLIINIKFNGLLMRDKYKNIRKIIANIIDRNEINKKLDNVHLVVKNFCLDKCEPEKNSKMIFKSKNIKLKFGYTDYYPNLIIAKELKKQLKKYNIELELVKYNLCCTNDCELYLDIDFAPLSYCEYFYLSKYFRLLHGRKYSNLCKEYEITKKQKKFKKMMGIVDSKNLIIPLLRVNYIYLCDEDLKVYNHSLFNYEKL